MTKTIEPNAELGWQVLDEIKAHPGRLDMALWVCNRDSLFATWVTLDMLRNDSACGTTACYAGWTVLLAGYKVNEATEEIRDPDGNIVGRRVDVLAAEILGINLVQQSVLFYGPNEDIEHAVTRVFGPRPAVEP